MVQLQHSMMHYINNIKNYTYYKWTTWKDPTGVVTTWIDNTNGDDLDKLQQCRGLVRPGDNLVFQNTLSCTPCTKYMAENYTGRCKRDSTGVYLKGTDIFQHEWGREPRAWF